ncbi:MAG: hypothetical protein C4532_04035 [Candidatus Abyssobacteria bacterium SURF_17]|uniref:CO-methylating acetyl-CoA synthase n=1 Tax=Candidatus Abyssobacteria bacterium SURF_17 TaxID=2093361 RepID=A0A419F5J8_9BACT|nr:MAG: hypothetical protein C4532_04035 [Candidatus Abyssubacteria bacterium SURF_17]
MFDETIRDIQAWFRQKSEENRTRRFDVTALIETSRMCSNGENRGGRNPQIILKEDTHIELGHPSAGSCSVALATCDSSLVVNGRVTLIGPDIPETEEKMLPFAQIAFACCRGDIAETSWEMDRILHVRAQTDGYMLRSVPNLIWARVSKEAARSGFSLRDLGARLIEALNSECAGVTASEVLFVTSSREDVSALDAIVETARNKLRKLQTFERKADGTYECTTSLDCTECPEKPVCDTVRQVITIRKGDRIIRFGGD